MKSELSLLRKVGFAEGISALVLFFVAMPMKYIWHNESIMNLAGNIHGFLFVGFMVMLFITGRKYKWSTSIYVICFLAVIPPFGEFILDKMFFKPLSKK